MLLRSIERRQRIVEEWEQLGQHVIDNAIRQWHRRLRRCVNADVDSLNILCN